MKTFAIIAAVGALALTQLAQASMVYNFDIDKASDLHTYSGVGVVPGDAGTVWNSLAVDTSLTSVDLASAVDSDGNATGISVTMTRNGGESLKIGYYTDGGNPNPSDLMSDYVYWDTWYVTVSGLDAGAYNLYGMGHGNQIDQTCTFTWGAASASTTQDLADFRDIFQAGAEGNTYVKLAGTVDGSGVLAFTTSSGFNGFQLEAIPEPATIGLLGIFGGGIVFIRRKFKI